ncbi:MAG: hypothetical protein RIQ60_1150 [Pseudomonadota bacterium]|jgi:hypothetical protein
MCGTGLYAALRQAAALPFKPIIEAMQVDPGLPFLVATMEVRVPASPAAGFAEELGSTFPTRVDVAKEFEELLRRR